MSSTLRPDPVAAEAEPAVAALSALIAELPEQLRRQALTHSSWTERRADSFERLAFLGDSVLGLSVASAVYARFPDTAAGGLTKTHNQAVSGVSVAEVGQQLGVPEMLREAEPEGVMGAIPVEMALQFDAKEQKINFDPHLITEMLKVLRGESSGDAARDGGEEEGGEPADEPVQACLGRGEAQADRHGDRQ